MRVVAGAAKGMRLRPPSSDGTRPISDRGKEALFNILAPRLPGARFLDLFAGTGGVGIEALSRDAAGATFVEQGDAAIGDLSWNLEKTRLGDSATVVKGDVFAFLQRAPAQFDVVWVSPPQWQQLWERTVEVLDEHPGWVAEDGVLIVQCDPKEVHDLPLANFERYDTRAYGNVAFLFFRSSTRETH
jgi:16S rRNA (guanine966-N2)-methyltransferase